MPIFRALGMGVAILVLKFLMPDVASGIEGTLVQFFSVMQHVLIAADTAISR